MNQATMQTAEKWVSRKEMTVNGKKVVSGQILDGPIGHDIQNQNYRLQTHHSYLLQGTVNTVQCDCGESFLSEAPLSRHRALVHETAEPKRDVTDAWRKGDSPYALWILEAEQALADTIAAAEAGQVAEDAARAALGRYKRTHTPMEPEYPSEVTRREYLLQGARGENDRLQRLINPAREEFSRRRMGPWESHEIAQFGGTPKSATYEPVGTATGTKKGR